MSYLSRKKIILAMEKPKIEDRLVITPLLNENQIADGAVDVRLGTQFIITKRSAFLGLDISEHEDLHKKIRNYQEFVRIKLREPFILHPNELVLGSTLEYLAIPKNLSAYVLTRSSWGRLGLIIATATYVNAGFKGCLTLEIENLGETPLALYPGVRVAQLVINTLEGEGSYSGRYKSPTGPEFSKAYTDEELNVWAPKKVLGEQ